MMTDRLPRTFDFIEWQGVIRETLSRRDLWLCMEEVCRRYDRGEINRLHWEELCDLIHQTFKQLGNLKRAVE